MSTQVSFEVTGLEHIETTLTDAPLAIRAAQMAATKEGELVVEADAKRRVHRRTGRLQSSIHSSGPVAVGDIIRGSVSTGVSYAGDVEFGTKAHDILPVTAQALMVPIGGGGPSPFGGGRLTGSARVGQQVAFFRKVRHPGTKAEPFMAPALSENTGKILRIFQSAVAKALDAASRA